MNQIKLKFNRMNDADRGLAIIVIGLILGLICANLFQGLYIGQIDMVDSDYLLKLKDTTIDHKVLLEYVQWKNIKLFIIFFVGALTPMGITFIALSCFYIGFQISFFLSVIIIEQGIKGIILIIGYTLPHYILYGIITYFSLRCGYWLNKNIYQGLHMNRRNKIKFILLEIMIVLVLLFGVILGGYLETYVGSYLLRKIVGIF